MGTYTPQKNLIVSGWDDIGIRLGLTRFEHESAAEYRTRLLKEIRDPGGATEAQLSRGIARKVGAVEFPLARISIVEDSAPPDPVLKIDRGRFRLWSDYANDVLEVDMCYVRDDEPGYFAIDIADAVNATAYFEWDWVVADPDKFNAIDTVRSRFELVDNLRVLGSRDLPDSNVWRVSGVTGVPRRLISTNPRLFTNLVLNGDQVQNEGEYAFEYDYDMNMIVTAFESLLAAVVELEYSAWPVVVNYSESIAWSLQDPGADYVTKSDALDESTGVLAPRHLNAVGASLLQNVLTVSPVEWRKA
jgi:hypothetical protein